MNRVTRWVLFGVAVITVIPIQISLLPELFPQNWVPHLGLLMVFVCALVYGEGAGVVLGFVLGLLYDRFTVGDVGLHLFILPCLGGAIALVQRVLPDMGYPNRMLLLTGFVLIAELATMILFHLAGSLKADGWLIVHRFFPALFANLMAGALILFVVELFTDRRLIR